MPASSGPLDAIIIGAGWSGLTSALQLSKAGKKVLCVEARKRIGGRAFTHSWNEDTPMDNNERTLPANEKGYVVDFGCSYIHGYEEGNPVKEIAKRYGVVSERGRSRGGRKKGKEKKVSMLMTSKHLLVLLPVQNVFVSKPTATQIIGAKGALSKATSDKLHANLSATQAAAKSIAKENRGKVTDSSSLSSSQQQSLSSFFFDDNKSPLYSNLTEEEKSQVTNLSRLMHIPLGTEMENIALDYFGYEQAFSGTDGIPEGGFTKIISSLEQEIHENGGEIKLGQAVEKISNLGKGKGVRVEVYDSSSKEGTTGGEKQTLEAKTAIVTIPLAVLRSKESLFEPILDSKKREAIAKTTVGNLNKVLLTYERPWWSLEVGTFFVLPVSNDRSMSSSPSSLEEIFSSTTLIVNSLCASDTGLPASITSPSLLVMVGATAAIQLEKYSRLEVAEALDKYLTPRLLVQGGKEEEEKKSSLKHTFYSRWGKQEFTGGATTTPVTVGNSPLDFSTLAKSEWDGNLYFAGEHCEVNHRGSIAGAIVSAQTTSDQVIQHLGSSIQSAKH